MKPGTTIQEILLSTASSFANRELNEMGSPENGRAFDPAEQLEAACWNGLLTELLPEIVLVSENGEKLFTWDVETRNSCLSITRSTGPYLPELESSLDPRYFLHVHPMN